MSERRRMKEGVAQVPLSVEIEGSTFELVDVQRDGASAIYRGDGAYLRIGDSQKIKTDLALHKQMEAAGFPVPAIIAEGEQGSKAYFIEASLGAKRLSDFFADDFENAGNISQENSRKLLEVTERFAVAQLRTRTPERDFEQFANGIHLDILCEELPEYAEQITAKFEELKNRVQSLPFVLNHGDFNSHNLFPAGVIDLEDSFYGPFGHDLYSALVSIDYFPNSQEYEFFARYQFSEENKAEYIGLLDRICAEAGLPPLSDFQKDFEFTRGVWALVRMHKYPKLQKFRYDKFIKEFLS